MQEQRLPSKLIEDIERRLEHIQRKFTSASERVGLARKIVSASKPYWYSADKVFKDGKQDEILSSGYQVLSSFSEQVQSLDDQTRNIPMAGLSIEESAEMFASSTGTTASISRYPLNFDPEPIRKYRYTFDSHDEYTEKMKTIDPSLGQTFSSIKSAYYGTPAEGLRQALFLTRHTFDQLFDALVNDDEVRQQTWWSPENADKPKMVTRIQRMRYAAEKYVKDSTKRNLLVNGVQHMNDVYNRLQKLHSRDFLDEEKDKDVLFEMLNLLKNWIDSLKNS